MKLMLRILFSLHLIMLFHPDLSAQTHGQNKSVQLEATVQENIPRIVLRWKPFTDATGFTVYRKSPTASSWGTPLASNLPAQTESWSDSSAAAGTAYEYRVVKTGGVTANGYILSGFEVPPSELSRRLLLVIDTTHLPAFQQALLQWETDLKGEGWAVFRIPVSPADSVKEVKTRIIDAYNASPQMTRAILLLGNVPVPYSGSIAPDGHTPDHLGAWPADGYYADIDGVWTDVSVNVTGGSNPRTHNVPGDGKFDQNIFPSGLELAIGRVDMSNLPQLGNEPDLLRWYFEKNHRFRTGQLNVRRRALIDDNFPGFAEGFSASGWRAFPTLVGLDSISTTDYFTSQRQDSYLWSFGCGGGNYTSAGGIGNSAGFAVDSVKGVFTMLFGSYFGDWHNQNNFLRAAIARGAALTNVWSGRPIWHFHLMALGSPVSFSAIQAMNNSGLYEINNNGRGVHMALMGDPTLTAFPLRQPQSLSASFEDGHVSVEWTAAEGDPLAYHVYRRLPGEQSFSRIASTLIGEPQFMDSCVSETGIAEYMVRSMRLEKTPSGSFYNLGTGLTDTVLLPGITPLTSAFTYSSDGPVHTFSATHTDSSAQYFWDFGNQMNATGPVVEHSFEEAGVYLVKLVVSNACIADTSSQEVEWLILDVNSLNASYQVSLFPNPATTWFGLRYSGKTPAEIAITDLNGKTLGSFPYPENGSIMLDGFSPGLYFVQIRFDDDVRITRKLLLN